MLLQEPQRTGYDINFRLMGFHVRIHPGFFVLPLVFGADFAGGPLGAGTAILIFVVVFFLSILVHELGHSLVMRAYGVHSKIVLHLMGGLAIPDSTTGKRSGLTSNQQIAISAAGPIAGFLLCGLFIGIVFAMGGKVVLEQQRMFPMLIPDMSNTSIEGNPAMILFFGVGLFCNFFWSLLNLAPVIPLDGGQISSELFQQFDRRNGLRKAILTSVGAAVLIAVAGIASGDQMMGFFFAFMAYSSYMMLQQYSNSGGRY